MRPKPEDLCRHMKIHPPSEFSCMCCEDNANECNCDDCTVFCPWCNEMKMVDCGEVYEYYEKHKHQKDVIK